MSIGLLKKGVAEPTLTSRTWISERMLGVLTRLSLRTMREVM